MYRQLRERCLAGGAALLLVAVLATPALAYVDPGTTGAVFSSLGYLLALGGAALGFLVWPIKRLIGALRRNKAEKGPEGQE